jgi:hypothetical protein
MAFPRDGTNPSLPDEARWVIDRLTRVDWKGTPGARPEGDVDPSKSLLDLECLTFGDIGRFVSSRIRAWWYVMGGVDVVRFVRLTRDLEWVGLAVQAAIFQWTHLQLHELTGYLGEAYQRVAEIVDPAQPPPEPGTDALDPVRRDYIAYWSTVYLAFNASPGIWNEWVGRAAARKSPGRLTNALLFDVDFTGFAPNLSKTWTVANMIRFAVALDAYLRVDFDNPSPTAFDALDPVARRW